MVALVSLVDALRTGLRGTLLRVVEPTKGPWANTNAFGDQWTQELPATAGQVIQVLPKNNRLYGPPHVHSICLVRGDEVFPSNADVRARVKFGCGGVENTFDCDWLHGAQFSLVCNSITVSGVSYAPGTGAYTPGQGTVFLGVTVAKGSAPPPGGAGLSYTERCATIASLGAVAYDVQRDFTREVCVHVTNNNNPATATGVILEFVNSLGFLVRYDAQVCAGGRRIPVPGGANTLEVENTTGGPVTVVVQWFLGL